MIPKHPPQLPYMGIFIGMTKIYIPLGYELHITQWDRGRGDFGGCFDA